MDRVLLYSECAPTVLRRRLKQQGAGRLEIPKALILRIAVREIESWILADRTGLASFLGIAAVNF